MVGLQYYYSKGIPAWSGKGKIFECKFRDRTVRFSGRAGYSKLSAGEDLEHIYPHNQAIIDGSPSDQLRQMSRNLRHVCVPWRRNMSVFPITGKHRLSPLRAGSVFSVQGPV
jgi:hypothetical protein